MATSSQGEEITDGNSGCNYSWELPIQNPDVKNSAITYYCHIGDIANPRIRVLTRMLAQILSEPTFSTLRTKEQLGYIVSSIAAHGVGSVGFRITVQSEKDPRYVEERIDAFLQNADTLLRDLSPEEFNGHRQGLILKWTEGLKNLYEETNRFWSHIDGGYLDFARC